MGSVCHVLVLAASVTLLLAEQAPARDGALVGVWIGQSMEADGKSAPSDAARRMQFIFGPDSMAIRGNFRDDREQKCDVFTSDPTASPKQLECDIGQDKILGIYEIKGDELTVCMRHASFSALGRPTAFRTAPDSHLILTVMKKQ